MDVDTDSSPLAMSPWLGRNGSLHGLHYGGKYRLPEMKWTASPEFVLLANELASPAFDVYQFGVYSGGSMRDIVQRMITPYGTLWGFDSFTGLPEEARGVKLEGKHWNPGAWSSASALNESSPHALFARLRSKIGRNDGPVVFVRGFFNKSLTSTLKRRMGLQPALLVDVDVDLYLSARQCLTYMLSNGLLIPGSLVRYDDWKGDANWGETRAHEELTAEWKIKWRTIEVARHKYGEFQMIECERCSPVDHQSRLLRVGTRRLSAA